MKLIASILTLICLTSCSSSPFKEEMEKQRIIMNHMSQGKIYSNGEFDSKLKMNSNDGYRYKVVGTSIYPVEANDNLVKSAAVSDGKFKLIHSAPTEFKSIVQKAIGESLGYTGEYNQIETSVTEVNNLKGIQIDENSFECKTVSEPTKDGGYLINKECRVIVWILNRDLKEAYDFTVERKYNIKSKDNIKEILNQQLKENTISMNK